MRGHPPNWPAVLAASHTVSVRVSAWRGGRLLADWVPVLDGQIVYDDTAQLRRRLSVTVPAHDPQTGMSWDPGGSPLHPLAAYGQRLNVILGAGAFLFDHGWYLVTAWSVDEADQTVRVDAVDLAQLVIDARHYRAETSRAEPYNAAFTRLINNILPVTISPSLPPRITPAGTVWARERDKNLADLTAAWPARWFVNDSGSAHADMPYADLTPDTTAQTRLVAGAAGTVISRSREQARDRLYNAVVATGKADGDNAAPYGTAEITRADNPLNVSGPFGRRPRFYASELLTSSEQCRLAAAAILPAAAATSRTEPITAIPDPALELGDIAQVHTPAGGVFLGRVSGITMPLTATGGAMTVTVTNGPELADESRK
jgi:hypothetical protein